MNTITRRIKAAIEHIRAEKQFYHQLKAAGMTRFHWAMIRDPYVTYYGDYSEAIELANKVLNGTEPPQRFSLSNVIVGQLMNISMATRLVNYDRLYNERTAAHHSIKTNHLFGSASE